MEIIVHSDDTGATPCITSRILEAWASGLIDGFSILANGDSLDRIERSLKAHPKRQARLAVHLNLTEGRSILPPGDVPGLTSSHGFLRGRFLGILLKHLLGTQSVRKAIEDEVEREWRAQIERVIDLCRPRSLSSVDGHIHIHMIPFLFRLAAKLAKEYGISEIRLSREPFYWSPRVSECLSVRFAVNIVKHLVLQGCSLPNIRVARSAGISYPDAMIGVLYSGMMSEENILSGLQAAKRRGEGTLEVLLHIGRAQEAELGRWSGKEKRAAFALSPRRDDEYAALKRLRGSLQRSSQQSEDRQK